MGAGGRRRGARALAAVTLAGALAGGCTGGGEADGAKASGTPNAVKGSEAARTPSAPAAPERPALSVAELEKRGLEKADLPGYVLKKGWLKGFSSQVSDESHAACRPLARVMAGVSVGLPATTAKPRNFRTAPVPDRAPTISVVSLASYVDGGAADAFAEVRRAAEACRDGFSLRDDREQPVDFAGVVPVRVEGGDQAQGWSLVEGRESLGAFHQLTVIRKGNVLVAMHSWKLGGDLVTQPRAVIDAQLRKLG
ncbi:hypothetical protein ACFYVL_29280 [Streptomyces sp. NPDC004111]|uniref:hypothetical protein n=1 Tax=Streptomyces sp. NPDC004111 TaxID=3364690 RepID=UPI00368C69BB